MDQKRYKRLSPEEETRRFNALREKQAALAELEAAGADGPLSGPVRETLREEVKSLRWELAQQHLALVKNLARRFVSDRIEFDDLFMEGYMGLRDAVRLFEPGRGVKFVSYAYCAIRRRVQKAAQESYLVRVPGNMIVGVGKFFEARVRGGGLRAAREALEKIGYTDQQVNWIEMAARAMHPVRLDITKLSGGGDGRHSNKLADTIVDRRVRQPPDDFAETEEGRLVLSKVDELFRHLMPREAEVVRRRFGFGGTEETLEEIGRTIGVSKERVRQLESRAMRKMRDRAVTMKGGGQ